MINKKILLSFFSCLVFFSLHAQDYSYGIKAGLDFSTIRGELETDASGTELENYRFNTGFHIGAAFRIGFLDDKIGIAPEILFNQRGARYKYEGPGQLSALFDDGTAVTLTGNRRESFSIVHSYISLPVMVYYRPVRRVIISSGLDFGFLVSSVGSGENKLTFAGTGGTDQSIAVGLDYNFLRDDPGEGGTEVTVTSVDGINLTTPSEIGAYYYQNEDLGSLFNIFDLGLSADLTFMVTKGISAGFRFTYSLLDTTNQDVDFSRLDNGATTRDDKDRNMSLQVSLGFNF